MRLIDKEKFNERLDFLLYELNFYANKDMTGFNDERTRTIGTFFITHIHNMLSRTSEVEAIPVEWLLERAKLCTTDYADCLHYTVEAWQTEQKYMVNGQWKFPKEWEKENE